MSTNSQHPAPRFSEHGWGPKFKNALRGIGWAVVDRGERWLQNSFLVHLPAAVAVIALAWYRQLDRLSIGLLILCVAMVLVAEMFNSSVEALARAVTREEHPEIRMALDIASGAVLVACLFATVVGILVLFF